MKKRGGLSFGFRERCADDQRERRREITGVKNKAFDVVMSDIDSDRLYDQIKRVLFEPS